MLSSINSSVSALLGLSKKANTTANNVANVNTTGFKSSRVTFSSNGSAATGVSVNAVTTNFSQGGIAASENPSELAISGSSYFILRDPSSSSADAYSRDGNFSFNKEGFLTTSSGDYVQGWTVDPQTGDPTGSLGDIQLSATSPPAATTTISQITNLDSRVASEEVDVSLFDSWDGRNATTSPATSPIDASTYDYSSSMAIYDSQGAKQEVTIYYDRTSTANEYEFLVTTDPTTDQRVNGADTITATEDKGSGALMYGTLSFNTNGEIDSITAYTVSADGQVSPADQINLDPSDTTYSFAVNFTGDAENSEINLDFGATYNGSGTDFSPAALATSQYASSSTTVSQQQDGSASGFLQSVQTDTNGVISASYSNGQVVKKAVVALANFSNPDGLSQSGGNTYQATTASGSATTGSPGESGTGTLIPGGTEMSNVDLAMEIPSMMLTQRFFQANIKMIQASDEMLGSLLDIKT